ncbi:MAG TPA: ACP S-malonyltransferase [Firmicutes bacterium]|nr:ACP S-malonyltransferase [Bacillota bacterium]
MKTAFLFSGQGAQYVGMGQELAQNHPSVQAVFDAADAALGFSISDVCWKEEAKLNETEFTQPALLTVSTAILTLLTEAGIHPDYLAGLSLGEYTALTAAGAIGFEDAVRLVQKRGRFMTEAVPAGQGAMYAILGLERDAVQKVCNELTLSMGYVAPANYNAPGQIVIAGLAAPTAEAAKQLKEAGAKMVVPLKVSGPFHTGLLKPAAEKLEEELEKITFGPLSVPVVSNFTALPYPDSQSIRPTLIQQVMSPVRFEDSLRYLADQGVDTFIEIGPGKTLSGFVKRTVKGARILHVEDEASLTKTLSSLEG